MIIKSKAAKSAMRNVVVKKVAKDKLAFKEAAKAFGLHPGTVRSWCKKDLGAAKVAKIKKEAAAPPKAVRKEQALALVKKGVGMQKVAEKVGVSYYSVRKWCIQNLKPYEYPNRGRKNKRSTTHHKSPAPKVQKEIVKVYMSKKGNIESIQGPEHIEVQLYKEQ